MYNLTKIPAIYRYMTRQKQKGIHHCMPTDKPKKKNEYTLVLYAKSKYD